MKKSFVFVFLVSLLLFLLSSCGYTYKDIEEVEEKWSTKYYDLDEQCVDAYSRIDDLECLLANIQENYATAYCYYDDADPDITEEEAYVILGYLEVCK